MDDQTVGRMEMNLYGWELRKAPSGPDSFHHNGGGLK